MITVEIIVISFGLAMDAFAVAASYSLASRERVLRTAFLYGTFFGVFQFVMPLVGFILHMILPDAILGYSNVIAFMLLFVIGARMIVQYFRDRAKDTEIHKGKVVSLYELVALSFATSIDALVAGASLALIEVNILVAAVTIGVVAFFMSVAGSLLGRKAAGLLKKSELLGGLVLIAIAIQILVI